MKFVYFKGVRKEQVLMIMYVFVVLAGIWRLHLRQPVAQEAFAPITNKKVILIDAGHGGWDPGKVGEGDALEKDINLAISQKLQAILEQSGAFIVTTREEDVALSESKRQDLKNRKELANNLHADIMISIHQNSYPQQNVKGAQVFYYKDSEKSQALAEYIQNQLISFLDPSNRRLAKANTDYYILKQSSIPAVIVECGFLSNPGERNALLDEIYQEKVAWAIYLGLLDYYEAGGVGPSPAPSQTP